MLLEQEECNEMGSGFPVSLHSSCSSNSRRESRSWVSMLLEQEECNETGKRLLSELYGKYLALKIQLRSQRKDAPESEANQGTSNGRRHRGTTGRGAARGGVSVGWSA